MKNKIEKIKIYLFTHKKVSIAVLMLIVIFGYWGYSRLTSSNDSIKYVMATVKKGTLVSSVSGSGQVSALEQIDLKSEVSGTVTYIGVKTGEFVQKNKILFVIDNKDAEKAVRDAELSLESAKISLEKLKIEKSNDNINSNLKKSYTDGFTKVSEAFIDLPTILAGLESVLSNANLSDNVARVSGKTAEMYRNSMETAYYSFKKSLGKTETDYRKLNIFSSGEDIKNVVKETYDTVRMASDATKSFLNFVNYISQESDSNTSDFSSELDQLAGYLSKINSNISSLLSVETDIKNTEDSLQNADLDLIDAQLSLKQKENSLKDARDKIADYYIRAPFDGILASIEAKKGDTAPSVLGTIITNQKIATLSMNEVDVSKIKLGQKAVVTFDAIENFSADGSVAEIDTIGTTSQGVVSYEVKVTFDTNEEQIKPGMSVSASIITEQKENVLMIPSSAIKNRGDKKYVQTFLESSPLPTNAIETTSDKIPNQIEVITGITDDTNTEIISGLKEGDQIIARTISADTTQNTTSTTNKNMFIGGGRTPGF